MMELAPHRRSFPLAAGLATLATAVVAAWIELGLGGAGTALWIDDLATPLAAATACVACLRARARHGGRMRLFWTLLSCATACWTAAEVTWGVYALLLEREVPSPSWADVGYLAAIPLTVAALLAHPAVRGSGPRKARATFDGAIVATALLFLSWTLVLGPLWRGTDLSAAAGVVTVAYPFGDVVLVFCVVLALRGMTGADRLSLWCLLAGLLTMALSDSAYAYLAETGAYASGSAHLLDAGWVAAYLGIALAAFASSATVALPIGTEPSRPSLASLVAPLLPVLLALSVAAVQVELGHRLGRAAWLMAFGLIALVLVRQTLAVLELLGPGGRSGAGLAERFTEAAVGGAAVVDRATTVGPRG